LTKYDKTAQSEKGQPNRENLKGNVDKRKQVQKGTQILGYVPIQAVNPSLEQVELQKQIGEASPISNGNVVQKDVEINHVSRDTKIAP